MSGSPGLSRSARPVTAVQKSAEGICTDAPTHRCRLTSLTDENPEYPATCVFLSFPAGAGQSTPSIQVLVRAAVVRALARLFRGPPLWRMHAVTFVSVAIHGASRFLWDTPWEGFEAPS